MELTGLFSLQRVKAEMRELFLFPALALKTRK